MKKNKEDHLNEKFELILNDCINGNLFDFQEKLNKFNKKQLFQFFLFLQNNKVDNYIYKQVSRALKKIYI